MRLFFCLSFQPGEVYAVAGGGIVAFFEEHRHVDGGIGDGACGVQVVVGEDDGFAQAVFLAVHDVCQGAVGFVVFAGFHLNGQDAAFPFDDEVQFATLFVVVVVGFQAVRCEFLGDGVFVDSPEVDVLVALDDAQLDAFGVLGGKQPDVVLVEFEEVA